jgi:hypothetical protein
MKKEAIIIILGLLIFFQPLSAQTWGAAKRLTWNLNHSYSPAIAVDSSNNLHVVWYGETSGNREIHYKKSTDEGITWNAKRLTYNSGDSERPAIALDSNSHIHVAWEDDSPGNREIYYKKSTNGGSTWITKRLTLNSGSSILAAIAIDSNDHIHIVWRDDTPGNLEIYYTTSTNGGTSWTTKRLTYNSGESTRPSITIDSSNHIHVVWANWTPGDGEIYYKKSTDGGVTWITKRLTWNSGNSYTPSVVADSSNNIHLVWYDDNSGNNEIYYKRSTDAGATWGSAKRLTWNPGISSFPIIAVDSSNRVHVVWKDSPSFNNEVYYRRSKDGGETWNGGKRLTWNSGSSGDPDVSIGTNDYIHVVWEDSTPGQFEIFYRKGIQ